MTDGLARYREVLGRLNGFRTAATLIAFAELGIGDALADGPLTPDAVAERIDADSAATARFLRAAAALGLVEAAADGRFANAPLAADSLTSAGPAALVNLTRREAAFYMRWIHLAEAVRSGRRPEANTRDEDAPTWVRDFTLAGYDTAQFSAPAIVAALAPLIEAIAGTARVLDVGGGSGGYSLALAARYPRVEALVLDLPRVIETTRAVVLESGLSGRVKTRAADFRRDDLGRGYHLALVFGVLVGGGVDAAVALLRAVRAALAPGGHVVIRAPLPHASHNALDDALTDLHMLLSTDSGGAHRDADIQTWLATAGFEAVPPLALPEALHGQLLLGRAPLRD